MHPKQRRLSPTLTISVYYKAEIPQGRSHSLLGLKENTSSHSQHINP